MALLALLLSAAVPAFAVAVAVGGGATRTELTNYTSVRDALLHNGARVAFEFEAAAATDDDGSGAIPLASAGMIDAMEWFMADYSPQGEYFAFSVLAPQIIGEDPVTHHVPGANATKATRFWDVRVYQNGSKAEVEHILRDDTHGKLLEHYKLPLAIGGGGGPGTIRFWAVGGGDGGGGGGAQLTSYAQLKAQIFRADVPTFSFRYADAVSGDYYAGGYIGGPTARLVGAGTADERVELYVDTVTFYEPELKVQDWGRISYFAAPRSQPSTLKKGTTVSYDVLVQTRVEVLCCGKDVGSIIENNVFFLTLGDNAKAFA